MQRRFVIFLAILGAWLGGLAFGQPGFWPKALGVFIYLAALELAMWAARRVLP